MSTRGMVGYVNADGKIRGWYNHFDSYYSGLGMEVLEKFKQHSPRELRDFFGHLELVKGEKGEQFYTKHREIFQKDWSTFKATLQDGSSFINDGLFCEYAYIYNAEKDEIRVYRGFFTKKQKGGPTGCKSPGGGGYWCHHVFSITRENIPEVEYLFTHEHVEGYYTNDGEDTKTYWEQKALPVIKEALPRAEEELGAVERIIKEAASR